MKTLTRNGGLVDASAFVLMRNGRNGVCPMATFAKLEDVNAAIVREYEADAASVVCGGIPGGTHYYYVPVEHTP